MPRAKSDDVKSSAELDAEIKELLGKINAKKKASKAAKLREDREAEQAREYEENRFNREFVERAKCITRDMFRDGQETAYELIERMIRNPVKAVMSEGTEEERREALLRAGVPEVEYENIV